MYNINLDTLKNKFQNKCLRYIEDYICIYDVTEIFDNGFKIRGVIIYDYSINNSHIKIGDYVIKYNDLSLFGNTITHDEFSKMLVSKYQEIDRTFNICNKG